MKENTQFLLEKAESAIGAAESLLRDGVIGILQRDVPTTPCSMPLKHCWQKRN